MPSMQARQLRKKATNAERSLWRVLRNRQLKGCKVRRQHALDRYVVDFACLSHRLIVEVDGGQHATPAKNDATRTRWLEEQGYTVVRFWNHEILSNIEGVREAVGQALATRSSSPARWRGPPSPHRGEG